MKRGQLILLAVIACVVAAGIALAVWPRDTEPEYQGKRLSEWLLMAHARSGTSESAAAEQAIRAVGSNSVPWLIKWLLYEPSQRYLSAVDAARRLVPGGFGTQLEEWMLSGTRRRLKLADAAAVGFASAGCDGRAGVPLLIRRVTENPRSRIATRAFWALEMMGTNSMASLVECLRDKGQSNRHVLLQIIARMPETIVEGGGAAPMLIECLGEGDAAVSMTAAEILGRLSLDIVVPGLVAMLHRAGAPERIAAAATLGRIGYRARGAVPDFVAALDDPAAGGEARKALEMIAPEVLEKMHKEKPDTLKN